MGASFTSSIGGEVVASSNIDKVNNSARSVAAIVRNQSLTDVTSLNMLIMNKPSTFINVDNSSNKTLASPIIMVTIRRNNSSSPVNISLYFRIIPAYRPNVSATYLCSFYDANTSEWNESGCTVPHYNEEFDLYECSCNHTTTFALIWLPQSLSANSTLDAQDIASLVFQSISILCFLAIIIHGFSIRICNPTASMQAYHVLPLISCAVTMILFIFWIALTMTVYTKTSSENETKCFLSSSVLMFFVYFFLIFMFCVKTSVGYFNYLRFVHLFPEPSHRKLFTLLLISFFISITWVAFAAGFNSNSSFRITRLYAYKACWFTRDVIYYFLTIPACLFILINIIIFILVAKRIIEHVRNSTSPHQSYERMKRCVLVLLSSSFTQGIGWLFGPFITFVDPTAGNVLGWFFIIFNGLEGLWAIILYIIIRSQHVYEQKRVTVSKDLTESTLASFTDSYKGFRNYLNRRLLRRNSSTTSDSQRGWPIFNDRHGIDSNERYSSTC